MVFLYTVVWGEETTETLAAPRGGLISGTTLQVLRTTWAQTISVVVLLHTRKPF